MKNMNKTTRTNLNFAEEFAAHYAASVYNIRVRTLTSCAHPTNDDYFVVRCRGYNINIDASVEFTIIVNVCTTECELVDCLLCSDDLSQQYDKIFEI